MPLRNPVLSPLTLLNGRDGSSSRSGPMASYLPGTSTQYDGSDDEQQDGDQADDVASGSARRKPSMSPRSVSSAGGAGSVQSFSGRQ